MNIAVIADVLNELYNNGVIRSSHKLDERDFLQLAKAAYGSVIRQIYFDEKRATDNVYHFVASCISEREYEVTTDDRGRILVKFDYTASKIVRLPDGNGIIRITPISDKGKVDYSQNFSKGIAGSEYLYCTPKFLEDTGEQIFVPVSDQIRLYTATPPKKVEMQAVLFDEDKDIPDDVAWQIINQVLVISLKVIPVPVDTTDDSNPVVQTVKTKITTAQPL